MKVCPKCGCNEFTVLRLEYHGMIFDGNGEHIDDTGLCYSKIEDDNWHCCNCGTDYAGLHELQEEEEEEEE